MRRTKRLALGLVLMLALALPSCPGGGLAESQVIVAAIQPEAGDISPAQAEALAQAAFFADCGFTEAQRSEFDCSAALYPELLQGDPPLPRRYEVLFTHRDTGLTYRLAVASPSGGLLPQDNDNFGEALAQAKAQFAMDSHISAQTRRWEERFGPYPFWSYKTKAHFNARYHSDPGPCAIDTGITLPDPADLSETEALAQAESALLKEFDLTAQDVASLETDVAFHARWQVDEEKGPRNCWVICYRRPEARGKGIYPLIYQVNVLSPKGKAYARRNLEPEDLLTLGFSQELADRLTELTELWHVPHGGRFFHADPACKSVPEKYHPLKPFPTGKLLSPPFKTLAPCPFCVQ